MKLCNRNYSGNSILTVKVEDGIEICPACEKPAACHGKSIEQRALYWALSGDTGISSEAIARHMTNSGPGKYWGQQPPSDSSDRGRCIRLLELIPEWIPRLPELTQYDKQKQEGIVISNSGISAYSNSWAKQIPLIRMEGGL